MNWTKEIPTVPGWYWHRHTQDHSILRVVELYQDKEGLGCYGWNRHRGFGPVEYTEYMEWAGPIEPPEE